MTAEGLIKNAIFQYLYLKKIYCWSNQSVGIFDPVKRIYRKNHSPYSLNGTADILGILSGGRFLAIEVKSRTGSLTREQRVFLNQINLLGGLAFMARDVETVIQALEKI